jgi:GNAT superfamily N-acetyltransferase
MIVKPLQKEQIEEARAFMLHIIKEDFGYEFNPVWHKDIVELESTYLNDRSCFYIAEEDGKIIGTIAARPYDKSYAELSGRYTAENTLSIWRHYIRKDLRGKGIGKTLFNEVEKFVRSKYYRNLYLHTQRTIPGSLEYWLSRGFEITVEPGDEFQTVHMEKVL